MMFVVKEQGNLTVSLPAAQISPEQAKVMGSPLAQRILKELSQEPNYPKALSKKLRVHEQKVYYHIARLEKARIIRQVRTEHMQGAIARYYQLSEPSFVIPFRPFQEAQKITSKTSNELLAPFVQDGQLNAAVIVGSPDPHGPEKARSRDGYYGIDFGLFLGTFLSYVPRLRVKLDTEVREEDLKQNLILIGGPVTNRIVDQVNSHLPIYFDAKNHNNLYSKITKNVYSADETGLIVRIKNPFIDGKHILVVAGKRASGTRAAIIAFLQELSALGEGNKQKPSVLAKVVEGVDLDSDGVVDAVEILE